MTRLTRTFVMMLGVAALLVLGLGIYAEKSVSSLARRTRHVLRENYRSVTYMDQALDALAAEDRTILRFLFGCVAESAGTSDTLVARLDEPHLLDLRARFLKAVDSESRNITLPGENEAVSKLYVAVGEHEKALVSVEYEMRYLPNPDRPSTSTAVAARRILREYEQQVWPKLRAVQVAAEEIRKLNHDWMMQAAGRQAGTAPRLLIGGTTVALLALLGAGLHLGRRLSRQLRELEILRTHFVALASHELRTPLTSLRMGLDLLSKETVGPLTPEQRSVAEANLEDCDRLLALSRQILDVTRIQAGRLEVHRTAVELRKVLSEAVSALRRSIQEKRVTVDLDISPDAETGVQVDPVKATWVATNLLSNALRYTPENGEIRVTARSAQHEVLVSVSDTGPGIAPEIARHIFKPYYQAKSASPESSGATGGVEFSRSGTVGLGLTIAQEIVAAHGGRIWVESAPFLGRGTTITFSLPRAEFMDSQ